MTSLWGVKNGLRDDVQPLLATRDQSLTDSVQATALALGVDVVVVGDREGLRRQWAGSPIRLVGADMVARTRDLASTAARTWVVGRADASLLMASAELRVPVLALPEAAEQLADLLTSHSQEAAAADVVAVVGASGGVGTSTLAAGLASHAAARGTRSAVVELAGRGGGLDLLFGAETRGGFTWDDLSRSAGQLGDLGEHLLSVSGVAMLPLGREQALPPEPVAVTAVLGSLGRSHEVVFLDAGSSGGVTQVPPRGRILLMVAADVRGVAAARMVAERWDLAAAELVVRTGPGRTLPPGAVADALGLELLGVVRHDRSVLRLADTGGSIGSRRAHRFRRDVTRIWEAMQP